MRRHTRTAAVVLSSLAALMFFPAGGFSSTSPAAFRNAMNGICKAERAKTHAAGAQITSVGALTTNGPVLLAATKGALLQFKKLGTPPAAIGKHATHYIALQAQIVKILGQAITAAQNHDDTTAKSLFLSNKARGQSQDADAQALGTNFCFSASEPK